MLTSQDRESVVKLKLLASIKIGDKINTRYLSIQPDCFGTKLSRYMYGENRTSTIVFCRNTIEQIKKILEMNKSQGVTTAINKDMVNAKLGLVALQETYMSDVRVVSELEEIIQSM